MMELEIQKYLRSNKTLQDLQMNQNLQIQNIWQKDLYGLVSESQKCNKIV